MPFPPGRVFSAKVGETEGIGNYAAAHFKNAAAGYRVNLWRIQINSVSVSGSEKNFTVIYGRKDTDLSSGSYSTQSLSYDNDSEPLPGGATASRAQFASNVTASTSTDAPTVVFGKAAVKVDTTQILDFIEAPIVLVNGTGFGLKCQDNDRQDIDVTFFWTEEAL